MNVPSLFRITVPCSVSIVPKGEYTSMSPSSSESLLLTSPFRISSSFTVKLSSEAVGTVFRSMMLIVTIAVSQKSGSHTSYWKKSVPEKPVFGM